MASFDVIFIGGGPAGYVGAIRSAQLGLSVAVVEREGLGGTCVLWGCIPAKALLESAAYAEKMKKAPEFGVVPGEVKLDFGVAMKRSRGVSAQNSKGVEFLFKKNKVTWIKGTAQLLSATSVAVKSLDGKEERHEAKKAIVVSTGSRVKGLPQIGLELNKKTVISSDEALILEKAPKSVTIVGAGAVGCEFADVFAAFGSHVTLVEVMPVILPVEDADCSKEVERAFKKRKIDVVTGAKIGNDLRCSSFGLQRRGLRKGQSSNWQPARATQRQYKISCCDSQECSLIDRSSKFNDGFANFSLTRPSYFSRHPAVFGSSSRHSSP